MLYALIAAIALFVIAAYICNRAFYSDSFILGILAGLLTTAGGVGMIACMVGFANYHGAQYKADVINREYGTDYTQQEIFYADSVINIVRELDRKRIEINGDIRRQRDAERNLPQKHNR